MHWNLAGITEVFLKREQELSTEVTTESGTETDLQETQPEQSSSQYAERSQSNTQIEEKDYTM